MPTAFVTGATGGLGAPLVTTLADAGWDVVAHGRSADRLAGLPTGIRTVTADLASLEEVAGLPDRVGPVDVLVNNAGVGFGAPGARRETSVDGFELRWAVNHLAPVLLTRLFLQQDPAPRRIVQVGSLGQEGFDLADVAFESGWDGTRAYRRSKLALAAWSFDEATRTPDTTITVIHPGTLMPTGMVLESEREIVDTVDTGVAALLRLVTDPSLDGVTGVFFDGQRESRAKPEAYDPEFRRQLRELTDRQLAPFGR
jgi:NAD(P)-dependent dehydrogenase (short-subunit alcohol dehydrogenase family)